MEITTEKPVIEPIRRRTSIGDLFKPLESIPRSAYLVGVAIGLIIIFGGWSIFSYSNFVKPSYFLPNPTQVLTAGWRMAQNGDLFLDAETSIFVIMIGWAVAALLAVPFGILMGSFKIFEALFEPVVDFMRYLPVSALVPLLLLYLGIGLEQKIAVVFLGTFFQLTLLVADVTADVSKDLLDSAYTLGASPWRVLTIVLVPATLPGVMDVMRITVGWAWTYVIVAELVAAQHGLGIMIMESERGLRTDRIFFGLLVIGTLGFITDFIFKWLHRKLLPWSPRVK